MDQDRGQSSCRAVHRTAFRRRVGSSGRLSAAEGSALFVETDGSSQDFATMRIKRKDIADVTYEHTAEMIFVEFVCYFGGLLGLWLGVSILDVYHQCLIWYGEAPGEYRKWLEKQKFTDNVTQIRVERSGRIAVISDKELEYDPKNVSIVGRLGPEKDILKTITQTTRHLLAHHSVKKLT